MKHQSEIYKQRTINMQAGITTADRYLSTLQNNINDIKSENFEGHKEEIIEEIEEIKDFLSWIRSQ